MHCCTDCPGTNALHKFLEEELSDIDPDFRFHNSQWQITDRAFPLMVTSAVLNNIRIVKTLLICDIVSKISIWMLNGYSLQLVMASHHAMVLGDLLNNMLQNVVYKDPSIIFFGVIQEEMVNVCADLEDCFAKKSKTVPGTSSVATILYQYLARKLLTNSQVRIASFFNLILTNH